MLYAILCYDDEEAVAAWTKEKDDEVIGRLLAVQAKLAELNKLGPVARLCDTPRAKTIRKGKAPVILDGPFAETKEQLLGFYVIDCVDEAEAIATAEELARASGSEGAFELRPLRLFRPGGPVGPA